MFAALEKGPHPYRRAGFHVNVIYLAIDWHTSAVTAEILLNSANRLSSLAGLHAAALESGLQSLAQG